MPPLHSYLRSLHIAFLGGSVVVAVGLMVLAGWVTRSDTLLRVRMNWTPMVPMTATAFVLSGAALLAITATMLPETKSPRRWRVVAMILGAAVAVIGLRRTWLYLFGGATDMDMLGFDPRGTPGQ